MYAYRATWIIKQGSMREAVELLKAEAIRAKPEKASIRIYSPDISPNVLVWEDAWESAKEHDKFWDDYWASPESKAFMEKFNEVAKRWTGSERWIVTKV